MNCAPVIRIPTANGILTHSANELRSTSGQAECKEDFVLPPVRRSERRT